MPPQRRRSDRTAVKLIGWTACIFLAVSLTYAFINSLVVGPEAVDPLFFAFQTLASLLFLLYSIRLGNRIFVAANSVALANAIGTILVFVLG